MPARLLVTVGTESVLTTVSATVPARRRRRSTSRSAADWGAGAYVTATLYPPGRRPGSRMPMRAIGVKWLKVDPGERKLAITLDAAEKTLPRQPLAIPVWP